MKRNLFLRLCLMMIALLSLHSCIHDEIISSSDPSTTEYTNKSLWKQDEKYITNVMKVYAENEAKIKKVNGIPYWNYATTVDSFDESFVAIPVVDNGKVISVLKVPRHGTKIYFYFTNEESDLTFFQRLVFAKNKKAGIADGSTAQTDGIACTRQWISVWLPNSESNPDGSGHWESVSIIKCKQIKDECVGVTNEFGICEGGTGDDGGYTYPGGGGGSGNEPEEEDPCDKLKSSLTKPELINTINQLENPNNFTLNHERMFIERNGVFTELPSSNCQDYFYRPPLSTTGCITTTAHTHQNVRCDGTKVQNIPSETDIFGLLYDAVNNHYTCGGSYNEVNSFTISQSGTYILNYNGTDQPNMGFNLDVWSELYKIGIQKLIDKKTFISADQEAFLAKFLKDVVNIEGLEVYKKEGNTIKKLEYDPATNTATETPCPN